MNKEVLIVIRRETGDVRGIHGAGDHSYDSDFDADSDSYTDSYEEEEFLDELYMEWEKMHDENYIITCKEPTRLDAYRDVDEYRWS